MSSLRILSPGLLVAFDSALGIEYARELGAIKQLSLNIGTFLNEVKGLFEANVEPQLFQEDIGEKKSQRPKSWIGLDLQLAAKSNKVRGCFG